MTNSLRLRLLLWLLLPMTVYVVAAGWIARNNAQQVASLLQDDALLSSARVLAGDIRWQRSDVAGDAGGRSDAQADGQTGARVDTRADVPATVAHAQAGTRAGMQGAAASDTRTDTSAEPQADSRADAPGDPRSVLRAEISPSAIEILSSPYGDQVFFNIREVNGPTIAGTSDFPQHVPAESPEWYDASVGGRPIRAVAVVRRMYDSGTSRLVIVSVGRTTLQRDAMAAQLWRPQMLYFAGIVTIAVVLVCVGLTFELRPLVRLARGMLARTPNAAVRLRADPLRNELRPIVDAFNQCLEIIERQTATQRRFISDAAHQLRTPLTLLGTQLQFARRQNDLDEVKDTLLAMHRSNRSLVALTNQLLLLAQAEAADYAHFEGKPVELRAVATDTIEQLALLAQRRGIELEARLDEPARVMGNAQLLSVLFFNLLDNAIRYTPAGGHVTLAVATRDGRVVVTVSDDGPGIPAEIRSRVFEPFFRASAEEGSGLGLAIVREIARAHRGEVLLGEGSASAVGGSAAAPGAPGGSAGLVVTVEFPGEG